MPTLRLLLWATPLLLAACSPCEPNTIRLTINIGGAALQATSLHIEGTIDGVPAKSADLAIAEPGQSRYEAVLRFPGGYRPGATVHLELQARKDAVVLAAASQYIVLTTSCTTASIVLSDGVPPDLASLDWASTDGQATDLATDGSGLPDGGGPPDGSGLSDGSGSPDGSGLPDGGGSADGSGSPDAAPLADASPASDLVASTCTDKIRNGDEGDVDCGGACPACLDGKSCARNGDCQSSVCSGGTCAVPTCSDGAKNGSEADVDCGGPCPRPCDIGRGCKVATDCVAAPTNAKVDCMAGLCSATCNKNFGSCDSDWTNGCETDLRVALPHCGTCGTQCWVGAACLDGVCFQDAWTKKSPAASPPPRSGPVMTYDSLRGVVVLFGGLGACC